MSNSNSFGLTEQDIVLGTYEGHFPRLSVICSTNKSVAALANDMSLHINVYVVQSSHVKREEEHIA